MKPLQLASSLTETRAGGAAPVCKMRTDMCFQSGVVQFLVKRGANPTRFRAQWPCFVPVSGNSLTSTRGIGHVSGSGQLSPAA